MTSLSKPEVALTSWLPALILGLLMAIMASERPIATMLTVIDLDQSTSSRLLIRQLGASQRLSVQTTTNNSEVERQLAMGKTSGVLTIPAGYEESLSNGEHQAIGAKLNMVNYLQANQIHSQLLQQTITDAVRQQAKQFLVTGNEKQQAANLAHPVNISWIRHNNSELSYRQALLPGFLLQAWNLCFSLLAVWLVAKPLSNGTAKSQAFNASLLALLGYVAWLALIQLTMSWQTGQPLRWLPLLAGALNLLAMLGIALFMLGITGNRRLALNGMSVVAATALAFMGVSFPFASMNDTAQLWANLLPITSLYQIWLGHHYPALAILFWQAVGWLMAGSLVWFSRMRRQTWAV